MRFWMVITPISVVGSTFRIIPSVYHKEAGCRTTRPNSPRGQPWFGNMFSEPKIWHKSEKSPSVDLFLLVELQLGLSTTIWTQLSALMAVLAYWVDWRISFLKFEKSEILFKIWTLEDLSYVLGPLNIPRTLLVTKHFIADHS